MKHIRTEKQTTPIGQEIEIEWFSGTPEEVEKALRKDYGEIVVRNGTWEWTIKAPWEKPEDGKLSLYGTDDPLEKIEVLDGEEDEYFAKHTRNLEIGKMSELFTGEIEFCPVMVV